MILGTRRVPSHAMSINTEQKQMSELRDSAKVHPCRQEICHAQVECQAGVGATGAWTDVTCAGTQGH